MEHSGQKDHISTNKLAHFALFHWIDTRNGTGTVPYDGVQLVQASSCRDGKCQIDIDGLRH